MISNSLLTNAISYDEYRNLIEDLYNAGKSTGNEQSEAKLTYTKINLARIKRLEATTYLTDDLLAAVDKITKPIQFIILSEGWCGDSAQNLTVFSILEQHSNKINIKVLLRDENQNVMDLYLTNGSKSIPKIICSDEDGNEKFVWGPRPAFAQDLVSTAIKNGVDKNKRSLDLHTWYAKDKTLSLQAEILQLIEKHLI